jgi:hypothetical protein
MIETSLPARRFLTLAFIMCTIAVTQVSAEISLSGEQDGFLETGHYLVTGPVTVKRGKTLSFAPGCIVRFKRYTGIAVEGALKCAGTESLPILFTSENHRVSGPLSSQAPAPFDWNGILVIDSLASIDFEYVHVIYSTFGLDIKSSRSSIRLKNAVFDENGQFNVRVEGQQRDVKDNERFSFILPPWVDSAAVVSAQPEPPAAPPRDTLPIMKHGKKGAWKLPMRIGFGAVALAGVAAAFRFDSEVAKDQEKYDRLGYSDPPDFFSFYKNKRNNAKKNREIGKIIALIGACGFSVTFVF